MTVVLILRRIPVDPPREEAPEPTVITEAESEYRYPLGAGLSRKAYPYRIAKIQES